MSRSVRSRSLNIWMNGHLVGRWDVGHNAASRLEYDPDWVASKMARPLSLSLPLPLEGGGGSAIRGEQVDNFFENLLPDNQDIRRRIRDRFRARNTDAFHLLSEVGRDCVGAIQLLPPNEHPNDLAVIEAEPIGEEAVERLLRHVVADVAPGMDDDDDFRISIAGAQEKTALLWYRGQWCKPHGSTPTTHIFKLPLGLIGGNQRDMRDSVENEWLCAQIMRAFGIDAAYCEMAQFGQQKVLVVERFDRMWSGSRLLRLPQEDCCQALGVAPHKKYEADGGPGMTAIAGLLATSEGGTSAVGAFLRAQFMFYLMAATDGHGKNFSIQLKAGNRYELTPMYDVLSAWPIVGKGHGDLQYQRVRLAMGLRGQSGLKREIDRIMPSHFDGTARQCGYPNLLGEIDVLLDTFHERMDGVESVLPAHFPDRVYQSIRGGMSKMRDKYTRARVLEQLG